LDQGGRGVLAELWPGERVGRGEVGRAEAGVAGVWWCRHGAARGGGRWAAGAELRSGAERGGDRCEKRERIEWMAVALICG
jgi:hypothetical protein